MEIRKTLLAASATFTLLVVSHLAAGAKISGYKSIDIQIAVNLDNSAKAGPKDNERPESSIVSEATASSENGLVSEVSRSSEDGLMSEVTTSSENGLVSEVSISSGDGLMSEATTSSENGLVSEVSRSSGDGLMSEVTTSSENGLVSEVSISSGDGLTSEVTTSSENSLVSEVSISSGDGLMSEVTTSSENGLVSEVSRSTDNSLMSEVTTSTENGHVSEVTETLVPEFTEGPEIVDGPWADNVFDPNITVPEIELNSTEDIRFLLWTRKNKDDKLYQILKTDDDDSVEDSNFDGGKPTVFLAHGFRSSGTAKWVLNAKTEYLKFKDVNFIAIDWNKIAHGFIYPRIAKKVPEVATTATEFFDFLTTRHGLKTSGVYLVGHSLGAHLVGIMGSKVKTKPVPRITGLDPAGPGFYKAPADKRVEKGDAKFVDIIHTCAGYSLPRLGLDGSYGHVDFFPNGGISQKGCWTLNCSHSRAHSYWIESINGITAFKSVPCPDRKSYNDGKCKVCGVGCLNMGVKVAKNLGGNYFLKTNGKSPFATGLIK